MTQKFKKAIVSITALFLGGSFITFIGFFKGRDIAITASRPYGASGWTTSQEFISGCTYFPVVLGVSLILLSITLSAILFMHWINSTN